MATATETTNETKSAETLEDEEIDSLTDEKDLMFATKPKAAMSKSKLSRKLYNQQQRSAMGDTAAVVGVGLLTSALEAKVRADAMNDPSVKAAESEIARLQAVTQQDAPKMSASAKNEMRAALMAPVQSAQDAAERKAQNIAASMGQGSAKQFLDVAEVEIDRLAAQAAKAEAMIAEEDVRLDEQNQKKIAQARKDLAPLRRAMFGLRNAMVREPKAQFIRDVGQGVAKLISTKPAPDFSFEIEEARQRGATTEQLETLIKMSNQPFAKKRIEKYMKEIGVFGDQSGEIPEDKQGRVLPEPPPEEKGDDEASATPEADTADAPPPPPPPSTTEQVPGTEFPDRIYDYAPVRSTAPGAQGKGKLFRMRSRSENFGKDDPETEVDEGKFSKYVFEYSPFGPGGEPVWAVYNNNKLITPVMRAGTDQPLFFTLSQAKDSTNPIIRDLYSVGLKEGLY